DVSALSGSVTTAVLKLHVQDLVSTGIVRVHALQGSWSEGAVTHNDRPVLTTPLASRSISPIQEGTTIEIDITSIVRSWQVSPGTAYGVALTGTNGLHVTFDS